MCAERLGLWHLRRDEIDESRSRFDETLAWRRPDFDPADPQPQEAKRLAAALGWVATLDARIGDAHGAEAARAEALELRSFVASVHADDGAALDALAEATIALASARAELGGLQAERTLREDSVAVSRRAIEVSSTPVEANRTLIRALLGLATVLLQLGDPDRARDSAHKAAERAARLSEQPAEELRTLRGHDPPSWTGRR